MNVSVLPFEDRSYHTSWSEFINVTWAANPDNTTAFVNLGVHAATQSFIQHLWKSEATATEIMTHSYVMQPFLDFYCDARRDAQRGEQLSDDGVHYWQWVDHLRAKMLAGICIMIHVVEI